MTAPGASPQSPAALPSDDGLLRGATWLGTLAALALLGALWLPLPTYAITLACFGLPHVLAELRYVDDRFGGRLPRTCVRAIAALLAMVILVRSAAFLGVLRGTPRVVAELLLVAALAATVVPLARQGAWRTASLALVVGGALLALTVVAPIETLVMLAFAHNLTPVGFLAERLRGTRRRRALALSGLLFVVVPLVIVGLGLASRAASPLGSALPRVGDAAAHAGVYVPSFVPRSMLLDVFAAAVWLQGLHYITVLGVLPQLGGGAAPLTPRTLLWPRGARGRRILVGAGALSAALFAVTFHDARAFYGIAAAVHAWVEVPVLLAAAGPLTGRIAG